MFSCFIDFHLGLLSKGPQERADGDRDRHLRGRDRAGTHTTETHGEGADNKEWGGWGGGLAAVHT